MRYDTSIRIPFFAGMMQHGDGVNLDMRYATEALNCDTSGGNLKPMTAGVSQGPIIVNDVAVGAPIGTLMRLYRRFVSSDNDVIVAVAGGNVYYRLITDTSWTLATLPEGYIITDNNFDFITYEIVQSGETVPTDVLLFTNNTDGMFCLYSDDYAIEYIPIGSTGYKLGAIARHYERVWGANIKDSAGNPLPDTLIYSQAYDPTNWSDDAVVAEDDAGELDQPTWDGDSFLALRTYGSYLLAIKQHGIWRVMGTNPGDYVIKEQFGGGTIVENTVAVDGYLVYMLGDTGVLVYDGTETRPFMQDYPKTVISRINAAYRYKATGVVCNNVYYLALPLDSSTTNDSILEYNIIEKTWNLRSGVYVKAFLKINNSLYYTSEIDPYSLYLLEGGNSLPLKWVSGWQDLGAANVIKSGFEIYVMPDTATSFGLVLKIETEKREKTKTYTVPVAEKYKRLRLANKGRRFRLTIESSATNEWSLSGGIEIHMELDPD